MDQSYEFQNYVTPNKPHKILTYSKFFKVLLFFKKFSKKHCSKAKNAQFWPPLLADFFNCNLNIVKKFHKLKNQILEIWTNAEAIFKNPSKTLRFSFCLKISKKFWKKPQNFQYKAKSWPNFLKKQDLQIFSSTLNFKTTPLFWLILTLIYVQLFCDHLKSFCHRLHC